MGDILQRVQTTRGELVLRRTEDRLEVISNGVFLMDTSDGRSERTLIEAAVSRTAAAAPRVLIGGLGVGFSLAAAVHYGQLAAIDVVEIEPALVEWHHKYFEAITGAALADPRVRVIEMDIARWLAEADTTYDAICLDTDNGPNWLVFEKNANIYSAQGLELAWQRLSPGGVLTVWSASQDNDFAERLAGRFSDVTILETPQVRGVPDVVYVARR
jgi:spermidine synthase